MCALCNVQYLFIYLCIQQKYFNANQEDADNYSRHFRLAEPPSEPAPPNWEIEFVQEVAAATVLGSSTALAQNLATIRVMMRRASDQNLTTETTYN